MGTSIVEKTDERSVFWTVITLLYISSVIVGGESILHEPGNCSACFSSLCVSHKDFCLLWTETMIRIIASSSEGTADCFPVCTLGLSGVVNGPDHV
jgi:hypothetical protein